MRAAALDSRAPTARRGRRAAAPRGPCPRGRAPAAAGRPRRTSSPCRRRVAPSTWRNQRPQVGGSPSEPGRSRVTGWRCAESVTRRLERRSTHARRSASPAGRGDSGVRDRLDCGRRNSGPAATSTAPPSLHIARDVVEVEQRQDVAVRVAVEDDEVELLDLLCEQLARREGDQRQLVDRRAVLLLAADAGW